MHDEARHVVLLGCARARLEALDRVAVGEALACGDVVLSLLIPLAIGRRVVVEDLHPGRRGLQRLGVHRRVESLRVAVHGEVDAVDLVPGGGERQEVLPVGEGERGGRAEVGGVARCRDGARSCHRVDRRVLARLGERTCPGGRRPRVLGGGRQTVRRIVGRITGVVVIDQPLVIGDRLAGDDVGRVELERRVAMQAECRTHPQRDRSGWRDHLRGRGRRQVHRCRWIDLERYQHRYERADRERTDCLPTLTLTTQPASHGNRPVLSSRAVLARRRHLSPARVKIRPIRS